MIIYYPRYLWLVISKDLSMVAALLAITDNEKTMKCLLQDFR